MYTPLRTRVLRIAIGFTLLLGVGLGSAYAARPPLAPHGEIIWDTYGTPHVFGNDVPALYFGFGYAQARAHGDLLLHLYGVSRGRAAEYWGSEFAASDRFLLANRSWERAQRWYGAQTPLMRSYLDAFAAGINAFARDNPERLSAASRHVLPVSGRDVIAHWERVMQFEYLAPLSKVMAPAAPLTAGTEPPGSGERDTPGSNAWALAPGKSADGHAMLLSNPHLSWAPSFLTYFEAQLSAPGIDLYGATQVGFPVLRFCFNEDHGFTNTVNPIVAATVYGLTLADAGYRYDDGVLPFKVRTGKIRIKQTDGSLAEEAVELRESVHGPVFTRDDGTTVALRVAGLDRPFGIQEYWDLDNARSLDEFVGVLRRLQVPMFNLVYADRKGHILYQYNGMVPVHADGDFAYWAGIVPGNTSRTLWTKLHRYEDLPRSLDPAAGWVQNANNPPWLNTAPPALAPADYPPYMSPVSMTLRAEQSALLLMSRPKFDFDDFVTLKMSTHSLMAERLLGPLLAAARLSASELVQQAVELLSAWNGRFDNDSRAALLFETWAGLFAGPQFLGTNNFTRQWSIADPLATPSGIKDPAAAVEMLETAARNTIATYGALDRPLGDVSRFHLGATDVAGNGGFGNLGIFRVITWSPLKDGVRTPLHGETYVSAIEFSTPMKAVGLMSYGESSQADSAHRGDQLQLLSDQRLRPVWRTREEVVEHAESRKLF